MKTAILAHAEDEAEGECYCYLALQWFSNHDRLEILIPIADAVAEEAMQNLKFNTDSIPSISKRHRQIHCEPLGAISADIFFWNT